MPVYEYTALDVKGKTLSGILDAESAQAARQKLRAMRNYPVSLKEVSDKTALKEPKRFTLFRPFKRIRSSDVSLMTRQLATLVGAGFPLVSAIDSLIPQTKSHAFKRSLSHIKDSIVEGNSFAAALGLYPETFTPLFINMVRAGESSGTLEIVLDRLADITEKQQALIQRIRSALTYPILMLIIGSLVLFTLLTFIVPSITSIFTDMDQALPGPTVFLLGLSGLFKSFWWAILAGIIVLVIILGQVKKTEKGRHAYDRTLLKLPGFGILVKKLAVARLSRTLGSLLENGVTLLSSLEIVKNIAGNVLISEAVENAAREVGKGQGLHQALAGSQLFPLLFIQMVQVGEQSGELETMLNKVADVFDNEVESTIMSITSLLEPLMILGMGAIVGFIVLSICLPIFEMNQLIM